jgi:MFS transporter, ACS family, D-galactonate transporter
MKNIEPPIANSQLLTQSSALGTHQSSPRFRFVVMGALWMTAFFLFLDRVNISLAAPYIMDELGLTGIEMGLVLSVYYWGYILGQLSGGVASDRLSIRKWSTLMFAGWCVLTALTGLCRSVGQFAIVRGLFGVSEGWVANPINKLENNWLLPNERGWVYGATVGFGYVGLIVGLPLIGWLISVWGWRAMFYGTGALTILGVVVFGLLVYDYPHQHPWMSQAEKDFLAEALAKDRVTFDPHRGADRPLSFAEGLRMLTGNWVFWAICGVNFFTLCVGFTNLSWLPGYLVKERGYTIMKSGLSLALPYLAAFAGSLLGGYLGDRTGQRTVVGLLTNLLTGPLMIFLMLTQDMTGTIALMSLILFLNAAAFNALIVLLFDLFPAEVVGVAAGLCIGLFGGLGGVTGPLILGYFYDHTHSFFWGFTAIGVGATVSAFALIPVWRYEQRVKKEKVKRAGLGQV